MSKLIGIIPPQRFELIAPQLVAILKDEVTNQYNLSNNDALKDIKYRLERTTPAGNDEYPLLSVRYTGSNSVNKSNDGDQLVTSTYFIEVYHKAAYVDSSDDTAGNGDALSALKIQSLLGVCRAILLAPVYKNLLLGNNTVRSVNLSQINMSQPENNQDTESVNYGQLVVEVTTNESSEQIELELISSYLTNVKIALTEDGYTWDGRSTTNTGVLNALLNFTL